MSPEVDHERHSGGQTQSAPDEPQQYPFLEDDPEELPTLQTDGAEGAKCRNALENGHQDAARDDRAGNDDDNDVDDGRVEISEPDEGNQASLDLTPCFYGRVFFREQARKAVGRKRGAICILERHPYLGGLAGEIEQLLRITQAHEEDEVVGLWNPGRKYAGEWIAEIVRPARAVLHEHHYGVSKLQVQETGYAA